MSESKGRVRLFFEALVIVVSILLAFWIDAAWAGRLERVEEREAIAALHDEAIANADRLVATLRSNERTHAATLAFFEGDPEDLAAVSLADANRLLVALSIPNRAALQSGALDGLTTSGRTQIIRDPSLRQLLADWPSEAARIDQRSDLLVEREGHIHELLGRHADAQAWLMGSRSAASLDLRSLREDPELMSALAAMQRERTIYRGLLERLRGDLNNLVDALAAARQ